MSELYSLADTIISVEGTDFLLSQVIVAECSPVGKLYFFLDIFVVLKVELNFPIFFDWKRLDGDFKDTVDNFEWSEKNLTVKIKFEYFLDGELYFAFFLHMINLDVKFFVFDDFFLEFLPFPLNISKSYIRFGFF